MTVAPLTDALHSAPTFAPPCFYNKQVSLVLQITTGFFTKEEEIREKSNDALREARLKAEQDSTLLHQWIQQDWLLTNLVNHHFSIIFY